MLRETHTQAEMDELRLVRSALLLLLLLLLLPVSSYQRP